MSTNRPSSRAVRRRALRAGAVVLLSGLAVTLAPSGAGADGQNSQAGWDGATTAPFTTLANVTHAIGANRLWAGGSTGKGVGVALVDTGVAPVQGLDNPGQIVNGPDLSFEGQNPTYQYVDSYGHGTHLGGIIAGNDGTTGSFRGVAPDASLVSVKTASSDGAVDVSQVIAAIDWVVEHRDDNGLNIRVLNVAYGTASTQSYLIDPLAFAVENAWKHGIVVVVSAGNDGTSSPTLNDPAIDPYVISAGAADLHGTGSADNATLAPFSSVGSSTRGPDVLAPGVSIASLRDPGSTIDDAHPEAVVDTRYFRGSGTSQAAAVTSGAAALLLSARPNLTPDQVKALLEQTSSSVDGSNNVGMIDVAAAAQENAPDGATQRFAPATGTGSIEAARGGSHVALDGIELTGEQDIMGNPWVGAVWAAQSAAGIAWNGGSWNGDVWAGSCWCGSSWSNMTWSSVTWTGRSWTGRSWTAVGWQGKSWTGRSWTGRSWTGRSWTGRSWTGRSWTTA